MADVALSLLAIMADSDDRGGFLRLGLRPRSAALTKIEGKAASLTPRYWGPAGAWTPDFIPLDNRGNVVDITDGPVALAFAAYWYIATRWRAQKIAEAPLMVVEEDQDDGSEEWLPEHDLAPILDEPNPDFDMTELVERTSRYLDDSAAAIWVIDFDRMNRPGRLVPFKKSEFEVLRTEGRLYGAFKVTTSEGQKTYPAEQVVYFRDSVDGWDNAGKSRLDVAMSWLRLGEKSRTTIRELLENAVWPSLVAIPDVAWNPTPEMLDLYKAELNAYGLPGNKGKAFAMIGGGRVDQMAARIRDLVPEEVLDRVESVVAAISGVPAIVLQFQIGLVNSPWSQMEQARRMAYDDVVSPAWRRMEGVITRQLLRRGENGDQDKTHFVRFDRSMIAALQVNRLEAATIASMMGDQASLNERRGVMGLEPLTDPAADEVPELTAPDPMELARAQNAGGGNDPNADDSADDNADEEDDVPPEKRSPRAIEAKARRVKRRRNRVAAMSLALRKDAAVGMELFASRLLAHDSAEVERIVRQNLSEPAKGSDTAGAIRTKSDRGKQRVLAAILSYLDTESAPAWRKATQPQVQLAAERATAVIAADIGINYNLLHPHVAKFAATETAFLVKNVTDTTKDAIRAALSAGLESGKSTSEIARDIAESGGFAPSRARLIARTESTRASNGGPTETLKLHAKASGRRYTKSWATAGDARVRDEHSAMEGETVGVDEKFSNGRMYPDEPNCRCAVIFNEVES